MVSAAIANDVKSIHAGVSNIQGRLSVIHSQHSCIENFISENEKTVADKKELDDLVSTLGGKKLELRKSCMEGTCSDILQAIETEVKNASGHNMIWIRGSPGVGKSALAASISTQLQDQNRHVISFLFDHTQSTTITTDSL